MRIAREEVFGPVVSLIEFDTFEEAIEIANSIDYGLSTALYTKDVNRAFTAMRDLEAGITYINAPTIGAEVHLPFGGVKQTGNGHREGLGAIDFFTTWKAVYVDYSDKLQRAQIDNAESKSTIAYHLLRCNTAPCSGQVSQLSACGALQLQSPGLLLLPAALSASSATLSARQAMESRAQNSMKLHLIVAQRAGQLPFALIDAICPSGPT
jgi:delta 1-pyrroline-5-carboxylate dehydrogenase